jgi:hypothetical protein
MKSTKAIITAALAAPLLALGGGLAYASTTTPSHPAPARTAVTSVAHPHSQPGFAQGRHDWCDWRYSGHWCGWRGHGYGHLPQATRQHRADRHHYGYRHHNGYRGHGSWGYQSNQGYGYQGNWGNGGSGNYGSGSHGGNGGGCCRHGW